uniref:glucocorticoid modulatory element-binding protein 1 isoform X2 n=1 Tax=Doryrhamphus excisus TaxID=161450 RepID=UPI0025ADF8B2|nr:glucocorticoid modulatory element-binding protein 1 isoform X2 [Doryrhamphus excisus]
MATTEDVSVSTGQVMMVKTEDGSDADDLNKTQVILQLHSITAGDQPVETDASVMADQEHAETDEGDVELGCPITCGDSKAMLLVKKFVCPGINVKCVKYEDQLISPKQFVHISGKATLKDWKRAIRMGGVMLRKIMDSGQLDFYQHSTLCTNTCRSTKFDLLINNTRFPPDGSGLTTISSQAQESLEEARTGGDNSTEKPGNKVDWVSSSLESGNKDSHELPEDTLNFWIGIADVGLLGEVVSKISSELLDLLNGMPLLKESAVLQDTDIAVLSNLGQVFGLLDTVKKMLEKRRQQTDPNQEQILSILSNLDLQLSEQRKQQQVQALLSKPAKTVTAAKRQTKRPRLQRPVTPAATLLTSTCNNQTVATPPQFTILSPISLSSLGQPFTVADLPITSLAQPSNTVTLLPAGSQLFTRYMVTGDGKADSITLVDASPVQDHAHLGTMVSPVELVHLSQQTVGGEVLPMDGAMLVQGEVDAGQEHTVIEINPPPVEEDIGVMELHLTEESGGVESGFIGSRTMEVTIGEAEGTRPQLQVAQARGVQGVELDTRGPGVQIVVVGENAQGK